MAKYDPADFEEFKGKTFVTRNNHYSISGDGRILGRYSIEGAKILYVAGIENQWYLNIALSLHSKERLDKLILEFGEKPRRGLHLIVSLTPESAEEMDRNGLVTSKINRIEDLEVEEEVEEIILDE